ncbi:MAG TPA: hypothetical protein VFE60_28215, partial [Roseiarcus sp.]|nr:hypothetical protein [Roseiarcus sp.]
MTERLLRAEMVGERALRRPRRHRDVSNSGSGEAARMHDPYPCFEQRLTLVFLHEKLLIPLHWPFNSAVLASRNARARFLNRHGRVKAGAVDGLAFWTGRERTTKKVVPESLMACEAKICLSGAAFRPWTRCVVPDSDGASLSLIRQGEDALWQAFFTAAPARRRVFEPSSKHRKR